MAKIIIEPQPGEEQDQIVADTTELLNNCFFGSSTAPQAAKCGERRRELKMQMIELCDLLFEYKKSGRRNTETGKKCYEKIFAMLVPGSDDGRNRYGYTAFVRSFVRERLNVFPEFEAIVGVRDTEKKERREETV